MPSAITPNNREVISARDANTDVPFYIEGNRVDGSVFVTVVGGSVSLFTLPYDRIDATYPTSTTEVYVSKLASVTQQTVTVTYTDSSKNFITSVVRT